MTAWLQWPLADSSAPDLIVASSDDQSEPDQCSGQIRTLERRYRGAVSVSLEAMAGAAPDGFPAGGMEITHILVVGDLARSVRWYRDVLGATLTGEYGGTSAVFNFQGGWLLVVTGGGETPDKPGTEFVPPENPSRLSHAMTIRVPDCRAAYAVLKARGAQFLTEPLDRGWEVRCFFRDPDGHLFEISEAPGAR
jgi:catechol 2,3-dioxygenase-like lactoylglutathione lyase family enzyme